MLTKPPVSLCGQLAYIVSSYKCCKSLIGAFKPEKAFVGVVSVIVKSLSLWGLLVTGQTECKTLSSPAFTLHNECRHFPYFLISAFHNSRNPSLIEHCFPSKNIVTWVMWFKKNIWKYLKQATWCQVPECHWPTILSIHCYGQYGHTAKAA